MREDGEPYLELASTDALIDELRRRSAVFFCTLRPLVIGPGECRWRSHWGTDGGEHGAERGGGGDALARVLGLIEIAKHDLIAFDASRGAADDDGGGDGE